MLKRYTEYREMQQLRKDHLAKQKMRHLLILLAILGVLLLGMSVIKAIKLAEPVKSVSTVSVKHQEIEKFANMVTKPADTLTAEDLALLNAKAEDPCYAKNAMLPKTEMIIAIAACSS